MDSQGACGLPEDPSAKAGWSGNFDFPPIQGGDIAGVVIEMGPGVTGEAIERRVLIDPALYGTDDEDASPTGFLGSETDGGFARYVAVDASHAHDVQDSPPSDEPLACLPVAFGTAIQMLERATVRSGETVLVTGASGGVGLALPGFTRRPGPDQRCRAQRSGRGCRHRRRTGAGDDDAAAPRQRPLGARRRRDRAGRRMRLPASKHRGAQVSSLYEARAPRNGKWTMMALSVTRAGLPTVSA